jgi:hypothetical protein
MRPTAAGIAGKLTNAGYPPESFCKELSGFFIGPSGEASLQNRSDRDGRARSGVGSLHRVDLALDFVD